MRVILSMLMHTPLTKNAGVGLGEGRGGEENRRQVDSDGLY